MPSFTQGYQPKLLSSNHSPKSLSSFLRNACAPCHISCLRADRSVCSELDILDYDDDIDMKQLIVNEIRSRAMKARSKSNGSLPFGSSTDWSFSSAPPIASTEKDSQEQQEEQVLLEETTGNCDEGSEAFFSVKSFFSRSTSRAATVETSDEPKWLPKTRSVWEEFRNCEGWPFGLCRRPLVLLPPLPSTPEDSWVWRKRNSPVVRAEKPKALAGEQVVNNGK